MDEITKPHDLEDIKAKDLHPKKKFSFSFGGNHKVFLKYFGIAFFAFLVMVTYVNKRINNAYKTWEANYKTADNTNPADLDLKIATAINNYNTQIQPRFVDLENKVNTLQAPPPAPVETAAAEPVAEPAKPVAKPKAAVTKKKPKSAQAAKPAKRVPTSTKTKAKKK